MAVCVGVVFIYGIIFIPTSLTQNFNRWNKDYGNNSLEKVFKVISGDIRVSNGDIVEEGDNTLRIGGSVYEFDRNKGLTVHKGGKYFKVSEDNLSFIIDGECLYILRDEKTYINFNIQSSKFGKIGVGDE